MPELMCSARLVAPTGEVVLRCDRPRDGHELHHDANGFVWATPGPGLEDFAPFVTN